MIKKLATIGATAALLAATSMPVLAASENSRASDCGATHGAFADVNGNFGFLGQLGGTPGYHNGATGQEPGATGYNNSNVDCNPQN